MMSSTKNGEMERTAEVCRDILEREGINDRGLYFLVAFLRDQGRTLEELLPVLERRMRRVKAGA